MRKLVLALIALACVVPPAEAARRDEQGTSVSRQAPAKVPAQTRSTQSQRPAAAAPRTAQRPAAAAPR
ncbi:hypothetical protein, partial [Falsiroseomonas oryziterrae]|uniref:hypothetical protein n=1 Tax=Falsiroseomonas oryziterrae TaxID=2911368 RepID=UPI001F1F6AF4